MWAYTIYCVFHYFVSSICRAWRYVEALVQVFAAQVRLPRSRIWE